MTYHELVKKVQTAAAKVDATTINEHIAVQVNVTGEAEGAFYMEINDGLLYVMPYDYNDRDALLTVSGEDILAISKGKLDMTKAYEEGKVQVELPHENSLGKLLALAGVFATAKKSAKKETEKPAETTAFVEPLVPDEEPAPVEAALVEAAPAVADEAPAAPAKVTENAPAEKKPVPEKPRRGRKPSKTDAPEKKPVVKKVAKRSKKSK